MGWERLLVDAAVIGGKDRWERRLAGLRAEWITRYGQAEDDEARDPPGVPRGVPNVSKLAWVHVARHCQFAYSRYTSV
jgi:hypothetical protein